MVRSMSSQLALRRRPVLAGALALAGGRANAADVPTIRIGLVQFGTAQWIAEVIRRHQLDGRHGFFLETLPLASSDAGRIAIMGGQVDIVVLDWPFVAVQRGAGTMLCFAPFSSALGGVMVRPGTAIHELAHLGGKRLGVAGGPIDKSWMVVQAAARKLASLDLTEAAQVSYGAPPLLGAKLRQGELDAVLTYWNFAAQLEAEGCLQAISVADCAVALGLPERLSLVGFAFREDWARGVASGIAGFLAAVAEAGRLLAGSDEDWLAIRPLMGAPDDRLFARLRERFSAGVAELPDTATQERNAARLFQILKATGGTKVTGGLESLPAGVFWPAGHGAG